MASTRQGRQHCAHLGSAQGGLGQSTIRTGHEQIGRRVGVDPVLSSQPREELGDGYEPLGLGAERKRLSVALAVGEQTLLIGEQQLEGHLLGLFDAAVLREGDEVAQVATSVLDGGLGVVVDLHPFQVVADFPLDRCHGRLLHDDQHRGVGRSGLCRRRADREHDALCRASLGRSLGWCQPIGPSIRPQW